MRSESLCGLALYCILSKLECHFLNLGNSRLTPFMLQSISQLSRLYSSGSTAGHREVKGLKLQPLSSRTMALCIICPDGRADFFQGCSDSCRDLIMDQGEDGVRLERGTLANDEGPR